MYFSNRYGLMTPVKSRAAHDVGRTSSAVCEQETARPTSYQVTDLPLQ